MSAPPRQIPRAARQRAQRDRWLLLVLVVCAAALVGVLSVRYDKVVDWTTNSRNTLSGVSSALLTTMSEPIRITAFVDNNQRLRFAIKQLLERYQQAHPRLSTEFVNPQLNPRRTREAGVEGNGVLVIEYGGRTEQVSTLSEHSISNALGRLAREQGRWIAYLHGHGERDFLGKRRSDLGTFGKHMGELGFTLRPLELSGSTEVPDNVQLLIVLEPDADDVSESVQAIERYLARGGNMLWLSDAPPHHALRKLETHLGVVRELGLVVDPRSQLNGRSTPEFITVPAFASHSVSVALDTPVVFPTATSLRWQAPPGWHTRGIASSGLSSWLETGDLTTAVRFDDGADTPGPLDLVLTMERQHPQTGPQRIMVFADSDFLSNAYLGLAGNRQLGIAAVNWLVSDDALLDIPLVEAADLDFAPTPTARAAIALGIPLVVPVFIFCLGAVTWHRRRHR